MFLLWIIFVTYVSYLSCLLVGSLQRCGHLLGKGCFNVFCHFPMWCPVSGIVLDSIDSWSLSPYLLQEDQASRSFLNVYNTVTSMLRVYKCNC